MGVEDDDAVAAADWAELRFDEVEVRLGVDDEDEVPIAVGGGLVVLVAKGIFGIEFAFFFLAKPLEMFLFDFEALEDPFATDNLD